MLVERGLKQQDAIRALDSFQAALNRGQGALIVAGARIGGPAGRHRVADVDLAPVVGEVEQVMVAAPAGFERLPLPGERRLTAGGECLVLFQAREAR